MEFAYWTQELVEATSKLIGGRTINFMDCSGMIVASTEKERIGTFHEGAYEAATTEKPVKITKEELDRYGGAKEGYNMPVFYEDMLFGVVGIYGNPQDVEALANLLKVYVSQIVSQQFWAKKEIFRREVNSQMIRVLFSEKEAKENELGDLCITGGIHFHFPVRLYYFYPNSFEEEDTDRSKSLLKSHQQIEQELVSNGFISKESDLYSVFKKGFLWIHCIEHYDQTKRKQIEDFYKANSKYFVVESRVCKSIIEINQFFKEVKIFIETLLRNKAFECTYYTLEDPRNQLEYYIHSIGKMCGKTYSEELYARLLKENTNEMTEILLNTALVYFEEEMSITKASDKLHIHKNTMLYRLKKLYRNLGLEEESLFTKEFFIRLLISLKS